MLIFFYFLLGKMFSVIVGLYYLKYLPRPYRIILVTIAIAAIVESYGYYTGSYLKQHNSWLFNLYTLVDATLFTIAAVYLVTSSKLKTMFYSLLVCFFIVWVINIKISGLFTSANYAFATEFIFLTIIFIVIPLSNNIFDQKSISRQPIFWLSLSVILYCACDIPYMLLHGYLVRNLPTLSKQLATINTVLDIIRYPLTGISFILLGRQKQVVLKSA